MRITLTSTGGKVLASTVLVGAAASVAGLGTFGTFTSTTSASAAVASGTVKLEVGAAGTANRLSVAATGLVPGDTVSRVVTLSNTGDQPLAGIGLTTTASPSSKLDTDAVMGLQLQVDACSLPWAEATATTGYTYTCTGTKSAVLAPRAVIGSTPSLGNLNALTNGKADNLLVKMTLPDTADNSFQALASTISFSFTGTQRGATAR
jgi:spore coat-associated protein N